MNIPIRADVDCSDGRCGRTTGILGERSTRKITHFIVKEPGFKGAEHLVPASELTSADEKKITLRISKADLSQLEEFASSVRTADTVHAQGGGGPGMAWDFIPTMPDQLVQGGHRINMSSYDTTDVYDNIDTDEAAAKPSTRVEAIDGQVGSLLDLVVDPATMAISGFVMSEAHLWGHRDVVIPIDAVDYMLHGVIHINLDKQQVKELPSVKA